MNYYNNYCKYMNALVYGMYVNGSLKQLLMRFLFEL